MTNEPEWMKRFNKKIKENYFVTPSSHLNVYGLKAFIKEEKEKTKSELLSKIEEEMEKYKVFEPTCGYESEEENGFQKGLAAGEKLMKKEILLSLSKYKVNK